MAVERIFLQSPIKVFGMDARVVFLVYWKRDFHPFHSWVVFIITNKRNKMYRYTHTNNNNNNGKGENGKLNFWLLCIYFSPAAEEFCCVCFSISEDDENLLLLQSCTYYGARTWMNLRLCNLMNIHCVCVCVFHLRITWGAFYGLNHARKVIPWTMMMVKRGNYSTNLERRRLNTGGQFPHSRTPSIQIKFTCQIKRIFCRILS